MSPSVCPGSVRCEVPENFAFSYPKHLLKGLFLFHFTLRHAIFFNHTELCHYVLCVKTKSKDSWVNRKNKVNHAEHECKIVKGLKKLQKNLFFSVARKNCYIEIEFPISIRRLGFRAVYRTSKLLR